MTYPARHDSQDFLKPAGYRSYLSGKLHVDGSAPEGGFDRAFFPGG